MTANEQKPTFNLARRIKQRAWAPNWGWFASCAPGLEECLHRELKRLELEAGVPETGGVLFTGRLGAGYLANLSLRSAGRVLLRLADFRVRSWPDLGRACSAVAWEVFVQPASALHIQASLRKGNLKHSGRVCGEVMDCITGRMQSLGLAPPVLGRAGDENAQRIMVRAESRRATISLDSSGAHLRKRGYRALPGSAPLREDIAAALLSFCGYNGSQPLLDAMTGSGTLAIEAAMVARGVPPGARRGFAFQKWPCFRQPTWNHLLTGALNQMPGATPRPIIARDIRPQALTQARANAGQAGVENSITFQRADFFDYPAPDAGPGLVVINPPWGKRMQSVRQAGRMMARIGRRLAQEYKGWQVGAVAYRPEWVERLGLAQAEAAPTAHSGVKVALVRGRVG